MPKSDDVAKDLDELLSAETITTINKVQLTNINTSIQDPDNVIFIVTTSDVENEDIQDFSFRKRLTIAGILVISNLISLAIGIEIATRYPIAGDLIRAVIGYL